MSKYLHESLGNLVWLLVGMGTFGPSGYVYAALGVWVIRLFFVLRAERYNDSGRSESERPSGT